jgi:hypothetical protein
MNSWILVLEDSSYLCQFVINAVKKKLKQFLCLSSKPASHSLTVSRQTMAFKFYAPFHLRRALVFCSPMCLILMKNMLNIGHSLSCNNTVCCHV